VGNASIHLETMSHTADPAFNDETDSALNGSATAQQTSQSNQEGAAARAAEAVREGVEEAMKDWMHHAEEWQDEVVAYVKKHPFKAVGAAAAIGFLLGVLTSRK
jgi:ElaB/YqjD/DUF883 family membrane-anchored ribosome-binding protein